MRIIIFIFNDYTHMNSYLHWICFREMATSTISRKKWTTYGNRNPSFAIAEIIYWEQVSRMIIFRKNGTREKYRHVSSTIDISSKKTIVRCVTRLAWFPFKRARLVVRLTICSNDLEFYVCCESYSPAVSYHSSFHNPSIRTSDPFVSASVLSENYDELLNISLF